MDHKPFQLTPSQLKLQMTRQLKLINYLEQFKLEIKYHKGKFNAATDCVSRPPINLLSTLMSMHGYDTITWLQLYLGDYDFSTIYRKIETNKLSTTDQFLKDTLRYRLGQLCVSKHVKIVHMLSHHKLRIKFIEELQWYFLVVLEGNIKNHL